MCVGNYHFIRDVVERQKGTAPALKPTDCHISLKLSSSTFKNESEELDSRVAGPFFDKNGITLPYSAFLSLLNDDPELENFFSEVKLRYETSEGELNPKNDTLDKNETLGSSNFKTPKNCDPPPPLLSPLKKKIRKSIYSVEEHLRVGADDVDVEEEERILCEEFNADAEFGIDVNAANNRFGKTLITGSNVNAASGADDDDDDEIQKRNSRTGKRPRKLDFGESDESGVEDPDQTSDFEPQVLTQSIKKRGSSGRGRGRGKK